MQQVRQQGVIPSAPNNNAQQTNPPLPPSNPFVQQYGVPSIADGTFTPLHANQVRPNIGVVVFAEREQNGDIKPTTLGCCTATVIAKNDATLAFLTNAHACGSKETAQIVIGSGQAPVSIELLTNPLLKLLKDRAGGSESEYGILFTERDIDAAKMYLEVFLWAGPGQPHDHYSAKAVKMPAFLVDGAFYDYHNIQYYSQHGLMSPTLKFCALGSSGLLSSGADAAVIVTSRQCGGRCAQLADYYYALCSMPDFPFAPVHPEFAFCNVVGVPALPEPDRTCQSVDGSRTLLEATVQGSACRITGFKQFSQPINNPFSTPFPVVAETTCLSRCGSSGSLLELAESGDVAMVDCQSKMRKYRVLLDNGKPHRMAIGMICGLLYDQHKNPTGGVAVIFGRAMRDFLSWALGGYPGVNMRLPLTDIPANCLSLEAIPPYDGRSSKATIEVRAPTQGHTYTPGGSPRTVPIFGPVRLPPINTNTCNHNAGPDLKEALRAFASHIRTFAARADHAFYQPRLLKAAQRLEQCAEVVQDADIGLDNPPCEDSERELLKEKEREADRLKEEVRQEQQKQQQHQAEKAHLQQQHEQQRQDNDRLREQLRQEELKHQQENEGLQKQLQQQRRQRLQQKLLLHEKERQFQQQQEEKELIEQQLQEEKQKLARLQQEQQEERVRHEEEEALLKQQLAEQEERHQQQLQQQHAENQQQLQTQLQEQQAVQQRLQAEKEQLQQKAQQQQQLQERTHQQELKQQLDHQEQKRHELEQQLQQQHQQELLKMANDYERQLKALLIRLVQQEFQLHKPQQPASPVLVAKEQEAEEEDAAESMKAEQTVVKEADSRKAEQDHVAVKEKACEKRNGEAARSLPSSPQKQQHQLRLQQQDNVDDMPPLEMVDDDDGASSVCVKQEINCEMKVESDREEREEKKDSDREEEEKVENDREEVESERAEKVEEVVDRQPLVVCVTPAKRTHRVFKREEDRATEVRRIQRAREAPRGGFVWMWGRNQSEGSDGKEDWVCSPCHKRPASEWQVLRMWDLHEEEEESEEEEEEEEEIEAVVEEEEKEDEEEEDTADEHAQDAVRKKSEPAEEAIVSDVPCDDELASSSDEEMLQVEEVFAEACNAEQHDGGGRGKEGGGGDLELIPDYSSSDEDAVKAEKTVEMCEQEQEDVCEQLSEEKVMCEPAEKPKCYAEEWEEMCEPAEKPKRYAEEEEEMCEPAEKPKRYAEEEEEMQAGVHDE